MDKRAAKYGPRILQVMLRPDYSPMMRYEMAASLDPPASADSHGFSYALRALQKKLGIFDPLSPDEIAQLRKEKRPCCGYQ